jgi:lipoyl synthase
MARLSGDLIWSMSERDLLNLLNSEELFSNPKRIHFYAPSFTFYKTSYFCSSATEFPTITVTGKNCALNCKHCGGKVLETMYSSKTPLSLFALVSELKQRGAFGCLISGGCSSDGSVPLQEFMPSIARIKRDLNMTVFVHTGIVNEKLASQLKSSDVDAVLIDVIGSEETLREICNLDISLRMYDVSLEALNASSIAFIPHVVAGLHNGKLKGEFIALKMIASHEPSAVVIISFMPIPGTVMQKTKPPTPLEIARTIAAARSIFPQTPVVLGCMRPKGKHRSETDLLALKAGVDGIAFPSEEVIKYAKAADYVTSFSSFCCAQIYRDLVVKKKS